MDIPLNTTLNNYFSIQGLVQEAFGYKEDWVPIPMVDMRGKHWMIIGGERSGGKYLYSAEPFTIASITEGAKIYGGSLIKEGTRIYSGSIYTQCFLPKWVYRTPTHVMVSADTHTDGVKCLMIFDADLECTDDALRTAASIW